MEYDSMSGEEEYEPIDYNKYKKKPKKKSYKRAQKSFVVDDDKNIEYVSRPKKKRKTMDTIDKTQTMDIDKQITTDNSNNMITSTSIISQMKKNKDYDKRSTTKIVTNPKKKTINKSKKRNKKSNLFGTGPLIENKKTNSNVMYSNIALTVQEKYLQNQYKLIADKLLELKNKKLKQETANKNNNNISLIEAIDIDNNYKPSSNIILEPGQQTTDNNTNNNFSETFIKLSTQYIAKQNMETSNPNNGKNGIDVNYYFDNRKSNKKIELNQKKAIEKLQKLGVKLNNNNHQNNNSQIVHNNGALKKKKPKFSIKRRKLHSNNNRISMNNKSDNNNNMNMNDNNETDLNNNSFNINGCEADELNNNLNNNLNNETDLSTIEKAELALQFAEDKGYMAIIDDETHSENCNVYVGGLHIECDELTLRKLFEHCGDIKQIRLDWRKKGFGFIHYQTHEQAMEAIQDMDGRLIMGQPIKCRWAKNKQKEKELLLKEKEKELKQANGIVDDEDKKKEDELNVMNDNINTNHIQPVQRMQRPTQSQHTNQMSTNTVTSIGFLSKNKYLKKQMSGPPALIKVNNQNNKNNKNEIDDNVEYW